MTYFTPRLVLNASPLPPLQLSFQDLPRGQSGSSLQQDGVGSTWLGPARSGAVPPCFPACLRQVSNNPYISLLSRTADVNGCGIISAFHESSQCLSPRPRRTASLSFTLRPDGAFIGTRNAEC